MERAPHHLMNLTARPGPIMVRGEGSYLFDDGGKRYLDFVQGWAVNTLGHAPPVLADALAAQARTLVNASPAFHNPRELELSARLAEGARMDRVFFCNSGAEANEGAIKLARKWGKVHKGGASVVVTTTSSFHGRTLATMAASGKAGFDAMFPPMPTGFVKVPFGDADAMRAALTAETAAILVEPVQGEAGVVVPERGYLAALRRIADESSVLLMLDEVQTGIGRTGALFAHQHEGIVPDVMTLGKGLGGGIPVAALVATNRAACFSPGEQGGTFNGNPLIMAGALAILGEVQSAGFLENVARRGELLRAGLTKLGAAHGIVEVRGMGLLVAARLATPVADQVRTLAFEAGLLVNAVRPDTLRFMPALNVTESEIAHLLELLAPALTASVTAAS